MPDEVLSPITGTSLRLTSREELSDFVGRPDAAALVKAASFEDLFFTIRRIGLADCLELLPYITPRQMRGFIDLDCWHKDLFVRKPFLEWVAAFVQAGPEATVRALSGVDESVIALFLKGLVQVFEVERDDPPPGTKLMYTPDNRFAVEVIDDSEKEAVTVAMLVLDSLFRFHPHLGYAVLAMARYTTEIELEESAYENKNRRLELHGFVDYYDAMSIYSGTPASGERPPGGADLFDDVPDEDAPDSLPSVFAESLVEGRFIRSALESLRGTEDMERICQELTALGNRVLSANLVNLSEMDGVRLALEEMRDFVTIGLEHLTGGRLDLAGSALRSNYALAIFRKGFDQVAALRDHADRIAALPGFRHQLLDESDRILFLALRQFKPLFFEDGAVRPFRNMIDVELARGQLALLEQAAKTMLSMFRTEGFSRETTFRQIWNTAAVRLAITGSFEAVPIAAADLAAFLASGWVRPDPPVPEGLRIHVDRWSDALDAELKPLAGTVPDSRFISALLVVR